MPFTVSSKISDDQLSKVIQIESAGKPNAKAKTSSASGLGQFIDATWLAMISKYRADLLQGRTKTQILALRFEPKLAIEMLARFTEDNAKALGSGWQEGDLYLAHFAGVGVAKKMLRADQSLPSTSVFSASAIKANASILVGKTIGQVRAWAEKKMQLAGGRNWIGVFMAGEKKKMDPQVKAVVVGTAAAAPVVAAPTAAAGTDWATIGIVVACIVVCGLIAVGGIWYRNRIKLERADDYRDDAAILPIDTGAVS